MRPRRRKGKQQQVANKEAFKKQKEEAEMGPANKNQKTGRKALHATRGQENVAPSIKCDVLFLHVLLQLILLLLHRG